MTQIGALRQGAQKHAAITAASKAQNVVLQLVKRVFGHLPTRLGYDVAIALLTTGCCSHEALFIRRLRAMLSSWRAVLSGALIGMIT